MAVLKETLILLLDGSSTLRHVRGLLNNTQVRTVVAAIQAAASPCGRAIDCCSHAHAKNLHGLWPIRAPTVRLRQSERDLPAAPIRARELSSRLTGQSRILGLFGINMSKAVSFALHVCVPITCLWPSCHSLLGLTTKH